MRLRPLCSGASSAGESILLLETVASLVVLLRLRTSTPPPSGPSAGPGDDERAVDLFSLAAWSLNAIAPCRGFLSESPALRISPSVNVKLVTSAAWKLAPVMPSSSALKLFVVASETACVGELLRLLAAAHPLALGGRARGRLQRMARAQPPRARGTRPRSADGRAAGATRRGRGTSVRTGDTARRCHRPRRAARRAARGAACRRARDRRLGTPHALAARARARVRSA
jgi:hypothetical protein